MPQGQETGVERVDVAAWRTRIRVDAMSNYHYRMGEAIERLERNHGAAVTHLKACLELDPDHVLALGELIRVLDIAGQEAEARTWRAEAARRHPGFDTVLAMALAEDACERGVPDDAAEHLRTAREHGADAESCRAVDAKILHLRGLAASRDRPGDALGLFRAATDLRPAWTEPRRQIASLLDAQERHDEALIEWRIIADTDPDNGEANLKVGYALRLDGDQERAIPYLRRAAASLRGNDFAFEHLGLALLLTDRIREAVGALQRCADLDSDRAETGWRGLANARLALGEAETCLALCTEADRRFGRNLPRDRVTFLALMALERVEQARQILASSDGEALAALGRGLLDLDRAEPPADPEEWRRIAAASDIPHARLVLAGLLAAQGRTAEAEAERTVALQAGGGTLALRQLSHLPVVRRRLRLPDPPPAP